MMKTNYFFHQKFNSSYLALIFAKFFPSLVSWNYFFFTSSSFVPYWLQRFYFDQLSSFCTVSSFSTDEMLTDVAQMLLCFSENLLKGSVAVTFRLEKYCQVCLKLFEYLIYGTKKQTIFSKNYCHIS